MEFEPGSSHTAKAMMSNPTSGAFDYTGVIYMGGDLTIVSQAQFHLNAGEEKQINFPVTMPTALGVYSVYVSVFSGGQAIPPLYRAADITIAGYTPESIWTSLIEPKWSYFILVWAGSPQTIEAVGTAITSGLRALGEWSRGEIHELALTMLMGAPYRDIEGYQVPYIGITNWQTFEDYVRTAPVLNDQVDEIIALGGTFQDWVAYRIVVLFNRTYVIGFFSNDEIRQIFDAYGVSLSDIALTYQG